MRHKKIHSVNKQEGKILSKTGYVQMAEDNIREFDIKQITTSKIRNILSMISSLYTSVSHDRQDRLDDEAVERIQYIKMRLAYEAGRDAGVKNFIEKMQIIEIIDQIKRNREYFLLFCKYMESLVAYFKYYGGKD